MLGCVLVRILSTVPPGVVLPPLVGSYATVNTFIAIGGDPATSKSALMKAAEDFLIIKGVNVPTYNPGSAEAEFPVLGVEFAIHSVHHRESDGDLFLRQEQMPVQRVGGIEFLWAAAVHRVVIDLILW
jgi:hypothetical protein